MPPRLTHRFPLADWIDAHEELPYQLGASGMKHQLRTTREHLALGPRSAPDDVALREEVAARLAVEPPRLFLTHGASEANALVVAFVALQVERSAPGPPTVRCPRPEYPPLVEATRLCGYREVPGGSADLLVRSEPNNPTGYRLGLPELERRFAECRRWLVDETFREFTDARSIAARRSERTYVTGTLTKAFGADAVRLGWVVVPPEDRERFATFHGIMTDEIPDPSVGLARDLLADASAILGETRGIFQRNRELLAARLPDLGELDGPVAFDRPGVPDTEALCRAALERGVLTSPGRFFDDPTGVRLGLTRPSFAAALEAYLAVRSEFAPAPTRGPTRTES